MTAINLLLVGLSQHNHQHDELDSLQTSGQQLIMTTVHLVQDHEFQFYYSPAVVKNKLID